MQIAGPLKRICLKKDKTYFVWVRTFVVADIPLQFTYTVNCNGMSATTKVRTQTK